MHAVLILYICIIHTNMKGLTMGYLLVSKYRYSTVYTDRVCNSRTHKRQSETEIYFLLHSIKRVSMAANNEQVFKPMISVESEMQHCFRDYWTKCNQYHSQSNTGVGSLSCSTWWAAITEELLAVDSVAAGLSSQDGGIILSDDSIFSDTSITGTEIVRVNNVRVPCYGGC